MNPAILPSALTLPTTVPAALEREVKQQEPSALKGREFDPLGAGAEEASRALEDTVSRQKTALEQRRFGPRSDPAMVKRIEHIEAMQALMATDRVETDLQELAKEARQRAGDGQEDAMAWLRERESDPVARAAALEIAQAQAETEGDRHAAGHLEKLGAQLWQQDGDAIRSGLRQADAARIESGRSFYYGELLGAPSQPEALFEQLRGHFGEAGLRQGLSELRRAMARELDGEQPAVGHEGRGRLMIDLNRIATVRSLIAQADELREHLLGQGIDTAQDGVALAEKIFGLAGGAASAKTLFKAVEDLPRQADASPFALYTGFRRFLAQTPDAIWSQGAEGRQKAVEQLDMRLVALARAESAAR